MFIKQVIVSVLALVLIACSSSNNSSAPILDSGLDSRPSNLSCVAPEQGPLSSSALSLVSAFPNLPAMGAVTALRQAPGDSSQWYAATQDGRILVFDNSDTVNSSSVFLDIQSQVHYDGEQGLLGIAFHPDYATNGELYLYYSTLTPNLRSNISRFTLVNNNWQEEIILSIRQPFGNHNGGNILFGPNDGYLYIGLGDGGSGGDPQGHGQNRLTLLGSMLRIDVDNGSPYAIPADNPYFGNTLCSNPDIVTNPQFCPEMYAYGLRNPWRWSFDRATHELWLGDVGQGRVEEIDIIENGQNYGWVVMEGSECYNTSSTSCNANNDYILPVAEYSHNGGGASVVGGYVYRGNNSDLTFLYGSYLFADTYSGQIWRTIRQGNSYTTTPLFDSNLIIYSFAESLDGEIYVLSPNGSGAGNNIYKFVPETSPAPASPIPGLLSETGCFDSTNPLIPAAGVIPYDIIAPLWSDNAEKDRYFAIPNGKQINLTSSGDFSFPTGTVLIKNFFLNDKPIETRLLMRHSDYWGGYSYEWQYDINGNPTDAQLLDDTLTKMIDGQNWLYPSGSQCFECHTQAANISLGLESLQLNRDFSYQQTGRTENQLSTYQAIGLFSNSLTDVHRNLKLYSIDDGSAEYELRARSYLHANCAHCHQPNGNAPTPLDLRFTTPLSEMNACDLDPLEGDLGFSGIKILDPLGSLLQPNSVMTARMESLDTDTRMPPLGTEIVDDSGVLVLKSWIDELSDCNQN
ncbi:PQQ-dependent sugar dehydrogenase [Kaarinaea lacus]